MFNNINKTGDVKFNQVDLKKLDDEIQKEKEVSIFEINDNSEPEFENILDNMAPGNLCDIQQKPDIIQKIIDFIKPKDDTENLPKDITINIPDFIKNLPDENIADIVTNFIDNLPEFDEETLQNICNQAADIAKQIPEWLMDRLPDIINELPKDFFENLPDGVKEIIGALEEYLPDEITKLLPDFTNKTEPVGPDVIIEPGTEEPSVSNEPTEPEFHEPSVTNEPETQEPTEPTSITITITPEPYQPNAPTIGSTGPTQETPVPPEPIKINPNPEL